MSMWGGPAELGNLWSARTRGTGRTGMGTSIKCPYCGVIFTSIQLTGEREWRECNRWLGEHYSTHKQPEWVI